MHKQLLFYIKKRAQNKGYELRRATNKMVFAVFMNFEDIEPFCSVNKYKIDVAKSRADGGFGNISSCVQDSKYLEIYVN